MRVTKAVSVKSMMAAQMATTDRLLAARSTSASGPGRAPHSARALHEESRADPGHHATQHAGRQRSAAAEYADATGDDRTREPRPHRAGRHLQREHREAAGELEPPFLGVPLVVRAITYGSGRPYLRGIAGGVLRSG